MKSLPKLFLGYYCHKLELIVFVSVPVTPSPYISHCPLSRAHDLNLVLRTFGFSVFSSVCLYVTVSVSLSNSSLTFPAQWFGLLPLGGRGRRAGVRNHWGCFKLKLFFFCSASKRKKKKKREKQKEERKEKKKRKKRKE